jgi:hypothetical protein
VEDAERGKGLTSTCHKTRHIAIVELVDAFEIPLLDREHQSASTATAQKTEIKILHLSPSPLHILDDIKTTMDDELVEISRVQREAGLAIAALLGCSEFVLEERVVFGADYAKIVRHAAALMFGIESWR